MPESLNRVEQLLKKLKDPKFCDNVRGWSKEWLERANIVFDGYDEKWEWLIDDWENSLIEGYESAQCGPEEVFEEIVNELGKPSIVTAQELGHAFEIYLVAKDERIYDDFDELYDCFLNLVRFRLLAERRSEPFVLCRLSDLPDKDIDIMFKYFALGMQRAKEEITGEKPQIPDSEDDVDDSPEESQNHILWSGNGISVYIEGIRSTSWSRGFSSNQERSTTGGLVVYVQGRISEKALSAFTSELTKFSRPIIRSISLVQGTTRSSEVPYKDLLDFKAFISGCLDLLFLPTSKKDTMNRRFFNALRLISEADNQSSNAIQLALSVAAIEALLGKKGTEISHKLADGVAVLLEPDLARRSKACYFMKELYDIRSDTLHGTSIADPVPAEKAMALASCCLYGLWFRNDFKHRLGEHPDSPDELLKELRNGKWVSSQLAGVPEIPGARKLWE